MRPVIGVTIWKEQKNADVYEKVNEWNLKAISEAGGIPVMLYITDNDEIIDGYINMLNGILFTGGGDINPLIFGEEPIRELGEVEYDRDEFEFKLYKRAAEKNIPMLGICRGMQIMNIASGGTIYQDIYSQRPGTNSHLTKNAFGSDEYHSVSVNENSKLYDILKQTDIKTNSFHHQAINDLADDYVATAFAKDGIIECIESKKLNFAIGIQWHPETMFEKYSIFRKIFIEFVKAAQK